MLKSISRYFKLTIRFEQVYALNAKKDIIVGLCAAYKTTYIHI